MSRSSSSAGSSSRSAQRVALLTDAPVEPAPIPSPLVDVAWRTQPEAVQAARCPSARGRADALYASIVAAEAEPYIGVPWSTRELFVHSEKGAYAFWDVQREAWTPPSDAGRDALLHVIKDVLTRRCGDNAESRVAAAARPLLERVEKLLRHALADPDFELDGEDARRWVVFENCVFDAQELRFVPKSPMIRATLCTNWPWRGHGLEESTAQELQAALVAWRAAEAEDDEARASAGELLDALRGRVGDLGFVRSVFADWETAVDALKRCARALFALPMQEFICAQSPGAGGEDAFCNRMRALLGHYAANLPFQALTAARDETILGLRGKRFVRVREVGGSGHVVETLADGVSGGWIKARGLWGREVSFLPHFLLFVATTDVVVEHDEAAGPGLARRKKLLRFEPQRKEPGIEAAFGERNGSFFHLLRLVFELFLRGGGHTVAPVEPWMVELDGFVAERLRPTRRAAEAATAAQIREAFAAVSRTVDEEEAALRFAARGFAEALTHVPGQPRTTKRTYSYAFPEEDGPALVQLIERAPPSG